VYQFTAVRKDDYRYIDRGIVSNQAPIFKRRHTVGKYAALAKDGSRLWSNNLTDIQYHWRVYTYL